MNSLNINKKFHQKIILEDGLEYDFFLQYINERFQLKLTEKESIITWENDFKLIELCFRDKKWNSFSDDDDLYNELVLSLNKTDCFKKTIDNAMNFELSLKNLKILLKIKENELSEDLSQPKSIYYIKNLEDKIKKLEKSVEYQTINNKKLIKTNDVFQNKINEMEKIINKLQIKNEIHDNDIASLVKLNINPKYLMLSSIPNRFVGLNNNANFSLTNNNKTLQRVTGVAGWWGFRCDPPMRIMNNLTFSIRIDHTDKHAYIMMGWCMKKSDFSNGYHLTKPSFALYLYNGYFFNNGKGSSYIIGFKGKTNETYTSLFEIKEKTVSFFRDGVQMGLPIAINLTDDETESLCPFVDLNRDDMVRLVEVNLKYVNEL